MLICQSFYLLYYALNRGQNESYKQALLDFAYFVNVWAVSSVTEFSFPPNLNFNLLRRIQGA